LATPLLKAQADQVFTCGPLSEALFDIIPPAWQGVHGKDSQEIASIVAAAVRPGDVVLIKGSQGSKMAYVVRALQDLHVTEVRRNAV